ncbi:MULTISPECIES: hypothetical protein [unclassified Nonomuraea]|uniref:hypothetical protein n=1 Tax=unclassified Nonomuraea TaxID=2593643 RepID=UPI0033DF66C5
MANTATTAIPHLAGGRRKHAWLAAGIVNLALERRVAWPPIRGVTLTYLAVLGYSLVRQTSNGLAGLTGLAVLRRAAYRG